MSKLFVVIPALNEEKTIATVLGGIPARVEGVEEICPVVVNDGSTDRTAELARAAGATVLSHHTPRGVGAAFQTGLMHVIANRGDFLVTLDADGQFNPADIPTVVAPVIDGQADFSTASRFKDPALLPKMPGVKIWGNNMMSRLISKLTGQRYYDVSCGMRCYSRRAMLHLNLLGAFTYTQEVFLNLAFKRLRIAEVPIRVRGEREFGKSRVASNLFKYALNTSRIIFRAYRDYRPMAFFGTISLVLAVPSLLLATFFVLHYLIVGRFSPFVFVGFTSAGLMGLSLVSLHMGLIGDMLNRHRVYLEEILYRQRDSAWRDNEPASPPPTSPPASPTAAPPFKDTARR